jgi:hypothetical protein
MRDPYPSLSRDTVSSLPLAIPHEGADILLSIPFHRVIVVVSSTRHKSSGEVTLH